jgi:hypothetical protein
MIGAGRLWDRSAWAFLVSAGALAFVIYFYIAKADARESEKRKSEVTPKKAEKIVQQYGAALARGVPKGHIARYESYLPCSKEKIKQAFKLVLAYQVEHRSLTKDTGNLLIGAVSHLNAFVPDEKADRINANKLLIGDEESSQFMHDMAGVEIWAEMDEFVAAVQALDSEDDLFHQRVYTLIGLEYSERIEKAYWDIFRDEYM